MSPGPPSSSSARTHAELALGGPRAFRVRWWMWAALAIAIAAAAVVCFRIHGLATRRAIETEHRQAGLVTDFQTWVTLPPMLDAVRQAEAARLLKSSASTGSWADQPCWVPTFGLRAISLSASDRRRQEAYLATGATMMGDVARFLDLGSFDASTLGGNGRDPARILATAYQQLWRDTTPSLLAMRTWSNWFAVQATRAADPRPDLRRLDNAAASLSHPSCMIDGMIGIALASIRDGTWTYLAVRGRLTADDLQQWASEPAPHIRWMAESWCGERMWQDHVFSRISIGELAACVGTPMGSPLPWWSAWPRTAYAWLVLPHELAMSSRHSAAAESSLRGLPRPPVVGMPFGLPPILDGLMSPDEVNLTSYEAAFSHRLHRVIACLGVAYRGGRPLPDSTAAVLQLLPSDQLRPIDADQPGILYERLSPSRFRLGCDPHALPPIVPPSRLGANYGTRIGQPAMATAEASTRWSYEIDLDAILIPPPEKPAKTKKP